MQRRAILRDSSSMNMLWKYNTLVCNYARYIPKLYDSYWRTNSVGTILDV